MKKMNGDVWRELEEKLKQKAKTRFELQQTFEEEHVTAKEKWVRLEDALKSLQEIKEKYAVIPKEKAKKLCDLWVSQILKELLGFASS